MPISTFMGLQTALRGLLAEQEAIDTAGHNIANANTPGFSRQQAVLSGTSPLVIPDASMNNGSGAQLGTGVDVTAISRIRDQFLDIQYRAQNTSLGDATQRSTAMDQVQLAFAEPSDHGLASQVGAFWSAWSDLANAPESPAARQALVDQAQTMTQTFNAIRGQLTTVASQAGQQYATLTGATGTVQSYANQIAQLNGEISQAQLVGQSPNDLMDRRDQLLDQLSQLGSVSVSDPGNGLLVVKFGDAASPLVNGTNVTWPQSLTSATGGQLGALLTLTGTGAGSVASYSAALDNVAGQLISSVNALHTATPFFSGTDAATIAVAVTPNQVQTTTTGQPGANDVAVAIANLRGGPADQAYAALVAQIGSDVGAVKANEASAQTLTAAVNNRRQSVSGVSLDEEMTNLITFQRGYQASARTLTTVDELLDTLINRTGKVGL